jgi:hypothetical protein
MSAEAAFVERLREFLLDSSLTFESAENLIERACEVAARTLLGSIRECVEHAYSRVDPTGPRNERISEATIRPGVAELG